jgi:hypothetical protein
VPLALGLTVLLNPPYQRLAELLALGEPSGAELHHEVEGEGPPVVLVHPGFADND